MHLFTRNVNSGFRELVEIFNSHQTKGPYTKDWLQKKCNVVRETTRNGPVLRIAEPVTITYEKPRERVLFNGARDCNPFLALYEALWTIAGRNDVKPLCYYCKRMAEFSDDGETWHGAYGRRWRHSNSVVRNPNDPKESVFYSKGTDQLDALATHLSRNSNSRRAVLAMWDAGLDLPMINAGLDVPCNLMVKFKLVPGCRDTNGEDVSAACHFLDITVFNRSNDLTWGLLGTNYCVFSFLQEYVAARLGAEVGVYHHVTDDLHAYVERPDWKPESWLEWEEQADRRVYDYAERSDGVRPDLYKPMNLVPLVKDPAAFERELPLIVTTNAGDHEAILFHNWQEPFFNDVAQPMFTAFKFHKRGSSELALHWAAQIKADDWRIACTNWLERRIKK